MLDTETRYKACDFVTTYTGGVFYPLAPRVEDCNVIDIAHHLSAQSRYGGAASFWNADTIYSTAQHCCLLCDFVFERGGSAKECYEILHHDDPEAWLIDLPRPVKQYMPNYRELEHRVHEANRKYLGLNEPYPDWIDELDSRIVVDERNQLLADNWRDWNHDLEPLGITIDPWSPRQAEQSFLLRHATYSRELFGAHQYLRSAWGIPTDAIFQEFPFKTGGSDVAQYGRPDQTVLTDLQEVDLRAGLGRVAVRSENGMMVRNTKCGDFPRPAWRWIRGDFQLVTEGVQDMVLAARVKK